MNTILPVLDLKIQEHASVFNLGVCLLMWKGQYEWLVGTFVYIRSH